MRRRELLALLSSAVPGAAGCDGCAARTGGDAPRAARAAPAAASMPDRAGRLGAWRELDFPPSDAYPKPERAAVLARTSAPLLIALHGAGEFAKGLIGGSRGWRDDYDLGRADERLRRPPLSPDDFLGFVRARRLAAVNRDLAKRAFAGLCVACPFTPRLREPDEAQPFAAFVTRDLAPRLRREIGLGAGPTGIDGVSMGGRVALIVGLSHPELFAAVGAMQPALAIEEAGAFADLAATAMRKRKIPLRLMSSDDDPFLDATTLLSERLHRAGVDHELLVTPGPHDYPWNRGPGAIEMLLWHDRVLRGQAAI